MRWWEGLARVACPGPEEASGHLLVWEDGELRLDAHPDPEADRTLGALGGDRCPCLDVLDAWRETHGDGGILTVGARHAGDRVGAPSGAVAELRADLRRWQSTAGALVEEARLARDSAAVDRLASAAGPPERLAARRLGFLLLLGLDPALLLRLQASVAADLATRPDRAAQLAVATAARARPALEAAGWRGDLADITLAPDASVTAGAVTLPPTWLASVWGRGLAGAVDGALVVDVTALAPEGGYEVIAAPPGKPQVASRVGPVGE
jgi:hypothetical protein